MTNKALDIVDLKKVYSGGVEALKGVNLHVEQGDFFALLGPNGAGKSTTIGMICSLVNKSSGSISVFGFDTVDQEVDAKSCIGLVPQEFNFNQFETLQQIVTNQAGYYGVPRSLAKLRAEKYLKQLDLWEKRNARARELSGGMKRRLMIVRALMHEPKMLILDEPTAGVDIEVRRSMWTFLKKINEQGITIILTTHYLEEAEMLCRNIAIIDKGSIVENTSMKALLSTLNIETFVFDLIEGATQVQIPGFTSRANDDQTLEVDIPKEAGLNPVFDYFSAQKITVKSMRNKANRLEELFVRLVESSKANNMQSKGQK